MPNCTLDSRRNGVPVLYTTGTHYQVGYDVGCTFRSMIQEFLASFSYFQEEVLPAFKTESGRNAYEASLKTLQENFPQYVREVKGTADGAKVPFEHLMLLHLSREVTKGCDKPVSSNKAPMGCSSVCCNHEGQVLLGHTEDALADVLNNIYIVSAHITEDEPQGRYGTKQEGFTAVCYAGYLPGYCSGYNHHGFVYSINVLFSGEVMPGKTSTFFLTRALLGASTFEEAQTILRDRGVGAADGLSVNMSFSRQEGDILFHNAEVAPSSDSNESQLSVLTLSPGEHLLHTNKYLRLKVAEERLDGESSNRRHQRAKECPPPESKSALLDLLSDTKDPEYPFFRENTPDKVYTVLLGVFDLLEKTWTMWIKNPRNSDPVITLPLVYKWQK